MHCGLLNLIKRLEELQGNEIRQTWNWIGCYIKQGVQQITYKFHSFGVET